MRLLIISDPSSIHTKRWIEALSGKGIDILLFGVNRTDPEFYDRLENVTVYTLDYFSDLKQKRKIGGWEKIKYLKSLGALKKKIREFKPDILHAHYASSYGLLGALTGFHPYVISVWGSDVYEFPKVSPIHREILKYNLKKADHLLSTSHNMAKEAALYTKKSFMVTPFGVDTELFKKDGISRDYQTPFVVGNIKTLHPKYGIDVLIKAFKIIVGNNPDRNLVLKIIGEGEQKDELIRLVETLGLENKVYFLGRIPNEQLTEYYNSFSVFVSPSTVDSESFGVVAVEAMACECPVVVSDADGFREVVSDGETGIIVPKKDVEATAAAIQRFIDNPQLREEMGRKGRERVNSLYDWKYNVESMYSSYKEVLEKSSSI